MEEGKNRERLGELIKRQGFQKLLEATGIEPDAAACSGAALTTRTSSGKKKRCRAVLSETLKNSENTI